MTKLKERELWRAACDHAKEMVDRGDDVIDVAQWLQSLAFFLRDVLCVPCSGAGCRDYPDTGTWTGLKGREQVTTATCDACWGTGRSDFKGADLKSLYDVGETLESARYRMVDAFPTWKDLKS